MADENKAATEDHRGESNPNTFPAAAEAEARILEEVIIKKKAPAAPAPVQQPPTPAPVAPLPKPAAAPPPTPVPATPPPPKDTPHLNSLAEEVGLKPSSPPPLPKPAPPPAPAQKPIDISQPPLQSPALDTDIAKILEGVKLPERRAIESTQAFPLASPTFDTKLGTPAAEAIKVPSQSAPLQEQTATPKEVPSVLTRQKDFCRESCFT